MKKIFLLLVVAMSSIYATAQQAPIDSSKTLTRQDYLELSKRQKKKATAFLLTGGAIGSIGAIIVASATVKDIGCVFQNCGSSQSTYTTASVLMIVGGALCVVSIPIYVKASGNKKKGLSLSAGNQVIPQARGQSMGNNIVPSLSLTLNF